MREREQPGKLTVEHIRDYLAHPPARRDGMMRGDDGLERPAWIGQSVLAHACLLLRNSFLEKPKTPSLLFLVR